MPLAIAPGEIGWRAAKDLRPMNSGKVVTRLMLLALLAGPMQALGQDMPVGGTRQAVDACLTPSAWHALSGTRPRATIAAPVLGEMARRSVVLMGEQHGEADHHRWQLQTLAALHLFRPDLVLGLEAFPRRVQSVLDKWVAGELSVREFLLQSDWYRVWGTPASAYLPLLEFARLNRIPLVALNVERSLTQAIGAKGWDAVPHEQREGLSRPAPASEAYRKYLYATFREHRSVSGVSTSDSGEQDDAFRYFVESQITWDRAMAEALASRMARPNASSSAAKRLVVGIMGSGHIRDGYGVAHQLRDLGITSIGALLPVDADHDCARLTQDTADAVFAIPEARPDPLPPPRLGVVLSDAKGNVTISSITAGSVAEQAGLRNGDRIVSVAGNAVSRSAEVINAVRQQPPGTLLPMQVDRSGESREILVRFPPMK